jgi:hypothetical protein
MTNSGRDAQNDAAESVICVDEADDTIGEAGKLDAH